MLYNQKLNFYAPIEIARAYSLTSGPEITVCSHDVHDDLSGGTTKARHNTLIKKQLQQQQMYTFSRPGRTRRGVNTIRRIILLLLWL